MTAIIGALYPCVGIVREPAYRVFVMDNQIMEELFRSSAEGEQRQQQACEYASYGRMITQIFASALQIKENQ